MHRIARLPAAVLLYANPAPTVNGATYPQKRRVVWDRLPISACGLQTCRRRIERNDSGIFATMAAAEFFLRRRMFAGGLKRWHFARTRRYSGCTRDRALGREFRLTGGRIGRTYGRDFSQGFPEQERRDGSRTRRTGTLGMRSGARLPTMSPQAASFIESPVCGSFGDDLLSFTQLRDNASIQTSVVPAKAGTQWRSSERRWIPAFAGMTE